MKTVKVQGGLGNQLFCLGFAHRLAMATGDLVALDLASFASDRYGHGFELAPLAERLGLTFTRTPLIASRPVTGVLNRLPNPLFVSDRALSAKAPDVERRLKSGRYFNGYWQDEGWLESSFGEIVREHLLAIAPERPPRGVLIHYRTYKEEVRPDRRAVPDSAWFTRCFDHLQGMKLDLSDVALISDDPALALQRMGPAGNGVAPVTGGTMWSDMALLLRAKTLILTNSSFSWWGGYAGEATTILYPAKGRLFHYASPASAFTVVA